MSPPRAVVRARGVDRAALPARARAGTSNLRDSCVSPGPVEHSVLGRLTIGSRVAPRPAHRGVHAATILGGTMTISAGRQASSRGPRRRNDRLRVVVADDSVLLREGIARLLE